MNKAAKLTKKNYEFLERRKYEIAKKTLEMPPAMAAVMGGTLREEAEEIVRSYEGIYGPRCRG